MTELMGNYNPRTVSWFMYATHKSLRKYFEQIEVSEQAINRIKALAADRSSAVVLAPTHVSYFDVVILNYICYTYGIPFPSICATENLMNIVVISRALRNIGGFFVSEKRTENELF